jgi:hypothetical protein
LTTRQWLTPEEKEEVRKIISKLFAEGLTDRAIADTIRDRGYRGQWCNTRICQMRKVMGLKKGGPLPPELRGAVPLDKLPKPHPDPDGIDDPADDADRLPPVQTVEHTFSDLIAKMEDTVRFAKKVQDEFRKKGGAIFF